MTGRKGRPRRYKHSTISELIEHMETPDLLAFIAEVSGRKDTDSYLATDTADQGVVLRGDDAVALTRRQALDGLTRELIPRLTGDLSSSLHEATIDQRIAIADIVGQAPYSRLSASRHGEALVIDIDEQGMREVGDDNLITYARHVIPTDGIIIAANGSSPGTLPGAPCDQRAALLALADAAGGTGLIGDAVTAARDTGATWQQIGDTLGVGSGRTGKAMRERVTAESASRARAARSAQAGQGDAVPADGVGERFAQSPAVRGGPDG